MLELNLNQLDYPLLSLLIFIPVIGSFLLLFIRNAVRGALDCARLLDRRTWVVPAAPPEF